MKGLKIKQELKTTYILLKEYQETISTRTFSKMTDQEANIQKDLENSHAELQEKVGLVKLETDI